MDVDIVASENEVNLALAAEYRETASFQSCRHVLEVKCAEMSYTHVRLDPITFVANRRGSHSTALPLDAVLIHELKPSPSFQSAL